MSETEQHKGKAKLLTESADEAFFQSLVAQNGMENRPSYYGSDKEWILSEHSERYVLTEKGLYEVTEKEEFEDGDIYHAEKIGENEISFIVRFYNGGCPFSEALEQAINDMKEPANTDEAKEQPQEAVQDAA